MYPPQRLPIYALLITVAVAAVAGRILSINAMYEPYLYAEPQQLKAYAQRTAPAALTPLASGNVLETVTFFEAGSKHWQWERPRIWPAERPAAVPTFGSNDRSRWATVRALVDEGTYAIGSRDPSTATPDNPYGDHGIVFEPGWTSIDRVLRPARPDYPNEVRSFYSSKPPLFSTLVAGEYWLLNKLFGWSLADEQGRWLVVRTGLLTINALPFLFYLLLLARLVDRLGTTEWGKLFVVVVACFGTFLTPFAITLNNHTPAACSALFALAAALRIGTEPRAPVWCFLAAGFFGAFTACVELPALAFTALLFAVLLVRAPLRTLLFFLPPALLLGGAFFYTNYLAIGQWMPAYGEFGGPWYEYDGSIWKLYPGEARLGIEWASQKESWWVYAFHFLLGHHGVFSLTPVWILAIFGAIACAWTAFSTWQGKIARRTALPSRPAGSGEPSYGTRFDTGEGKPRTGETGAIDTRTPALRLVAVFTLVLTAVVLAFFLTWQKRWNYGGWTSGPRWLIWLTPFWLLSMVPVADWLATRRWGRGLAYALLAVSVISVSYPAWNPWRHPWLYNFLEYLGLMPY
jgi:hypothetical protein